MAKRTFASRTFKARTFQSATWAGESTTTATTTNRRFTRLESRSTSILDIVTANRLKSTTTTTLTSDTVGSQWPEQ